MAAALKTRREGAADHDGWSEREDPRNLLHDNIVIIPDEYITLYTDTRVHGRNIDELLSRLPSTGL